MKLHMKLVMGLAILSLGALPATAMADGPNYQPPGGGPNYHPGHPNHPPQGPKAAPKGKAYGYYCRGESKKHVKGEKGTEFSRCVKRLAQADKNPNLKPKKACKGLSKKHEKGEQGTEFSRCVKNVNEMRRAEAATLATSSVA